jgi:hypothetical protein
MLRDSIHGMFAGTLSEDTRQKFRKRLTKSNSSPVLEMDGRRKAFCRPSNE